MRVSESYHCPKCGSARIPGEQTYTDVDPDNAKKKRKFICIDYGCGTHLKIHRVDLNFKYNWFWVCQHDVTRKE